MAAGFDINKQVIDGKVGQVTVQLRYALEEVDRVKAWLDGQTTEMLQGYGYAPGDVDIIKSAFTDLAKLASIARGQAPQEQANDFFFWARRLTGLN